MSVASWCLLIVTLVTTPAHGHGLPEPDVVLGVVLARHLGAHLVPGPEQT